MARTTPAQKPRGWARMTRISVPDPAPKRVFTGVRPPPADPARHWPDKGILWRCNIVIFAVPDRGCNPYNGRVTATPGAGAGEPTKCCQKPTEIPVVKPPVSRLQAGL